MSTENQDILLEKLNSTDKPNSDDFRKLVENIDNHDALTKAFLLNGTPYIFSEKPLKYITFKEHIADKFNVRSQDICITGSACMGFSLSSKHKKDKYGEEFSKTSNIDVAIISKCWFDKCSHHLFKHLNDKLYSIINQISNSENTSPNNSKEISGKLSQIKDGINNFVYHNFNPASLPHGDPIHDMIFSEIASTATLFLTLEPKIPASKIRCRFFRNWKSAEGYYTNSLRELKKSFQGQS